jgi:hypothetical protein
MRTATSGARVPPIFARNFYFYFCPAEMKEIKEMGLRLISAAW